MHSPFGHLTLMPNNSKAREKHRAGQNKNANMNKPKDIKERSNEAALREFIRYQLNKNSGEFCECLTWSG